MRNVAVPISMSVVTNIDFRPSRSPKCPNTTPPTGRAKKPTAYVANEASVPANGSSVGKNSRLNTKAAAVPYRKKSYHSIVVPIKLASTTRRTELTETAASGRS